MEPCGPACQQWGKLEQPFLRDSILSNVIYLLEPQWGAFWAELGATGKLWVALRAGEAMGSEASAPKPTQGGPGGPTRGTAVAWRPPAIPLEKQPHDPMHRGDTEPGEVQKGSTTACQAPCQVTRMLNLRMTW